MTQDPVRLAEAFIVSNLGITRQRVEKEGGEWPQYECPECGVYSLVDTGEIGDSTPAVRYRCFNCGKTYLDNAFGRCSKCGELCLKEELKDTGICSDCERQTLEKF